MNLPSKFNYIPNLLLLTLEVLASGSNFPDAIRANAKDDENIKFLSKIMDEPAGKTIIRECKIKELVYKYLIEPCQQFVDEMGPDLFIPAKFDAQYYNYIDYPNHDYYLSWSYFNICRVVAHKAVDVKNNVVKYVVDMK